ncbi:RsmB/NOP family class I SAM-dependent RNA methyltransferase [Tranquillimonas alkanivorans]|uniref:16S rRNA (Cytosine967-C5)-methyltransferase n=1 Tax=Tranquillimonas alkanivorans TaxID=441119 RepID=A0A1I5NT70_9RHOB|nr:RsmB/NOP family class I SAM-dependent RNA methyltransferase [Tranquillimonas alkanivorans]SFP25018.1 16S rRNA (cytosine967-C5)-methyltransferase [Tranquillimonas alkanivorans]
MTPAARVTAAIEVLDEVLAGAPAEKVLTNWARSHRFAGSGDRAAIRDHVFDALRCRRSFAALGGAETGRGLMIGAFRDVGVDAAEVFTGARFAPAPLSEQEAEPQAIDDPLVALDCPDWLAGPLRGSLGDDFEPVMQRLRRRAPVFLRVNLLKGTMETALAALAEEGLETAPGPLAATALEVVTGARRVARSTAFRDGLVELQDAASQAVVEALPVTTGLRILDYCAGGGGKSLALAARSNAPVDAHDISPARMRDIPDRAARAGAEVRVLKPGALGEGQYDLVLADAPCSGSGAWRRSPEGKWRLDASGLRALIETQREVLEAAARHVEPGGCLAYATCSLLDSENGDQVDAFLARRPAWREERRLRLTPLDGGDGFFLSCLRRPPNDD